MFLILYVLCSTIGLVLIKVGVSKEFTLTISSSGFEIKSGWILILGMVIYVISFILSMITMSRMNLTLFYPLSAGLIYVGSCVAGLLFLHEKLSVQQLAGIVVILIGILIVSLDRG